MRCVATQCPRSTLPALDGPWLTFDRPQEKFREVLAAVGGQCWPCHTTATCRSCSRSCPSFRAAQHVWSLVPGRRLGRVGTGHA